MQENKNNKDQKNNSVINNAEKQYMKASYQKRLMMLLAFVIVFFLSIPLALFFSDYSFGVPLLLIAPFLAMAIVWIFVPDSLGEYDKESERSKAAFVTKLLTFPVFMFFILLMFPLWKPSLIGFVLFVVLFLFCLADAIFSTDQSIKELKKKRMLFESTHTHEVESEITDCMLFNVGIGKRMIKRFKYEYRYFYQSNEYVVYGETSSWKPVKPGEKRFIMIDPNNPGSVYDKELLSNEISIAKFLDRVLGIKILLYILYLDCFYFDFEMTYYIIDAVKELL